MGIPRQHIRVRRATAAEWAATNPVLLDGELGLEKDTNRLKAGNGASAWNGLAYVGASGASGFDGTLNSLQDVITTAAVNRSLLVYNASSGQWEATSTWTTATITDGGNF